MRIIILGAGRMGFDLARQLEREGHELVVVENDPERARRVRTRLDVMTLLGSGVGVRVLRDAGIDSADLLIAVTNSDEVNIVACLLSRELEIRHRMARVQSTVLIEELAGTDPTTLGVDEFFNPLQVAVERLRQTVLAPEFTEFAEFARGQVVLRALPVLPGSSLADHPLSDLRRRMREPFVVCTVKRGGDLLVPGGDFRLCAGDVFYVVMRTPALPVFLDAFGLTGRPSQRVLLVGADRIGCALASAIEREVADVLLLEPDAGRAAKAAACLDRTSVVHGSPLDRGLLEDLRVAGVDFFISTSDRDELNLSSALLAKRMGVERVVMLTSEPAQVELYESLPVDAVISPLMLCAGAILREVRGGRTRSLFKVAGGRGEAVEIEVGAYAPVAGKAIKDADLPAGVVVAAVISGGEVRVAGGETKMEVGDRVVVVTLREAWDRAQAVFGGESDA